MPLEDTRGLQVDSSDEEDYNDNDISSNESFSGNEEDPDFDPPTDSDESEVELEESGSEEEGQLNEAGSSDQTNKDVSSPEPKSETTGAAQTASAPTASVSQPTGTSRSLVRDKLLLTEIHGQNLPGNVPSTCELIFGNPDTFHEFRLAVTPQEGFWKKGRFIFQINVPEEYNFEPPIVKCLTTLWHPNINEEGQICLSILRQACVEDSAWNPTRQLKDVVFGINSLFTDLVNFDDPLNEEAAKMYRQSPVTFRQTVADYIERHAKAPKRRRGN